MNHQERCETQSEILDSLEKLHGREYKDLIIVFFNLNELANIGVIPESYPMEAAFWTPLIRIGKLSKPDMANEEFCAMFRKDYEQMVKRLHPEYPL